MNFLDLRGYNRSQNVGLAAGLALLVLLVAIHNPFRGYETWDYDLNMFFEWFSKGAMSIHIAHLTVFLGFIVLIVIFTAGWIWIFQSPVNKGDGSLTAKANEKHGEK